MNRFRIFLKRKWDCFRGRHELGKTDLIPQRGSFFVISPVPTVHGKRCQHCDYWRESTEAEIKADGWGATPEPQGQLGGPVWE